MTTRTSSLLFRPGITTDLPQHDHTRPRYPFYSAQELYATLYPQQHYQISAGYAGNYSGAPHCTCISPRGNDFSLSLDVVPGGRRWEVISGVPCDVP